MDARLVDWLEAALASPLADNVLGLAGLLLLALPALSAVRAAKVLRDFERRKLGPDVDPEFRVGKDHLLTRMRKRAQAWSAMHAAMLYAGYACLFASQVLGILAET